MAGGNISPQLGPLFAEAGAKFNIPPQVLAGVASVETGLGSDRSTSSTGAQGLMQFEPGTAASLHVNPNNDRQAVFGAAKLLTQMGYHQNPLRALGAYNGGPGNPQYGYARLVMSEANRLKGQAARFAGQTGMPAAKMPGAASAKGIAGGRIATTPGAPQFKAVTTNQFDQAAFDKATAANIAGNYVAGSASSDPYAVKGPKTGLEGAVAANPLIASGQLTTGAAPNPADYVTAQTKLQQLAGANVKVAAHPAAKGMAAAKGAAAQGNGGVANPFPHGFVTSRLDKGIDGTFQHALASPVNGTIVASSPHWSNWGGWVAVKADHPIPGLASDTFYFAEGLAPTVHNGQRVSAGQTIATPVASRFNGIVGNIEWGLANPAQPLDVLGKSQNTRSQVFGVYNYARKAFGIPPTTNPSGAGGF